MEHVSSVAARETQGRRPHRSDRRSVPPVPRQLLGVFGDSALAADVQSRVGRPRACLLGTTRTVASIRRVRQLAWPSGSWATQSKKEREAVPFFTLESGSTFGGPSVAEEAEFTPMPSASHGETGKRPRSAYVIVVYKVSKQCTMYIFIYRYIIPCSIICWVVANFKSSL